MATAQNKKLATAVAATIAGPILTLKFANDSILTIDANALTPDIQQQAMMHGLKQKLIDAAAIARDPETGRTATIDDKYNAVYEVYQRITAAEGSTWNKARGNGEGGNSNKGGMLLRAVMRLTSKSRADAMAWLEARSKEEVAALRKNPRIMEIMAALQVESANTNGIDSDSLLEGFMEGAELSGEEEEEEGSEEGNDDDLDDVPPVDVAAAAKAQAAKDKRAADRRAAANAKK